MRRPLSCLLVAGTIGCATARTPDVTGPATRAEHARVVFRSDTLLVEVANTEAERARGLMSRDLVPEGTGMLFVFAEPAVQGVWMKDTSVALEAAFLDARQRVLSTVTLEPFDETVRYSDGPVLYVLEVPSGWFTRRGIEVGDAAAIEYLPAPDPLR